jgi:uncharacterized cupin superfamily protein
MRGEQLREKLGSELIGASVYELPPGGKSFPYHYHHADEELLVVLSGHPTLRTPDGEFELRPGVLVVFRPGREGAHLLRNDGDEPARFLMISNVGGVEVAPHLDSGKVGVWAGELELMVRLDSPDAHLDYWEGESDPEPSAEKGSS